MGKTPGERTRTAEEGGSQRSIFTKKNEKKNKTAAFKRHAKQQDSQQRTRKITARNAEGQNSSRVPGRNNRKGETHENGSRKSKGSRMSNTSSRKKDRKTG